MGRGKDAAQPTAADLPAAMAGQAAEIFVLTNGRAGTSRTLGERLRKKLMSTPGKRRAG